MRNKVYTVKGDFVPMTALTLRVALCILVSGCFALHAQPTVTAVLNAADYSTDLAPGGLVSIFGTGFTSAAFTASSLPLPTTLGGVSITVNTSSGTVQAPIYYVAPTQINAQLPYGLSGTASITVNASAPFSAKIVPNAPKFFTYTESGLGFVVATHANGSIATQTAPVHPGEMITLYMNSLGAVNPPIDAGFPPTTNLVVDKPAVLVDSLASTVTYAGLTPGFPGLYQINVTTPFDDKLGYAPISVTSGTATTQSSVSLPVQANGLYYVVTGGKFVNGQSLNGMSGTNSSIAFRHNNTPSFPTDGTNAWTQNTGLSPSWVNVAGVALTLQSAGAIVFDNNGIENGTYGTYYDATAGSAVGTAVLFSMSNLSSPTSASNTVQGVYAGYFKTTAAQSFDQIIGYFEGPLNVDPPFDPANIYNTFRVNIFSNHNDMPAMNGYIGDILSSDTTPGTFSWGPTGVDRIQQNGLHIPIYRLVFTLKTPFNLPAGEYWFSHDVATPSTAATATSSVTETSITNKSLIVLRPKASVKEE